MDWFADPGAWAGRWVFTRGLALVYLIAFVAALRQGRALLGTDGLTPVPRYLEWASWKRAPSLFHLHWSDRFFAGCCWTGIVLSLAALGGLADRLPLAGWMALWGVLWALYLSIVNVGQIWYGFGWESLLLEAGFLAVFLGPAHVAPPTLGMWLLRWLLFRLEFGAGLIKMRGDQCWRDLTCLSWHHETQPMPNPLSWWFHRLSPRLHRVETLANHVTQLVVVFGLLAPQPIAGVAALVIVVTQGYLLVSGNFAWLNALTLVLALSVVDGRWLAAVLPVDRPDQLSSPTWFVAVVLGLAVLVAALSVAPVRNLLSPAQRMNTSFDPLRLVNSYGAFGSVTKVRRELVVEATDDPGPDAVWREYEFRGKPGDVHRRPPQWAPYHLRLDWLMWFVALSPAYGRAWLLPFLAKLLAADRATLRLLRSAPFGTDRPAAVRVLVYRYRFTTREERRETGAWWHRTYEREMVAPLTAADVATRVR
ncbi:MULTISPECIES: lipase maturation factor family protein [unclassified Modestobacter]|uniref:lipase maturation factor family protein n=1 Tax=unclassified Modestobacter TaxID=2643866 RepID=UPI0022AAE135|nr:MULTISPECIES: lipase maturation factor family protein [unclassified Modestobacter]MCZ2825932.1 lipase maturation factor family protein [Modestobacter sp. VKM Ac-2981]MCZ2853003.1 lipase maturation factor family protein [Modestobacter sp. VKM Ac-2982]